MVDLTDYASEHDPTIDTKQVAKEIYDYPELIIDYLGKQHIIEMKIWHGNEYNTRGEEQLLRYLQDYHLER